MKKILSLILLALFAFTQKSYAMEKPIIKSVLGRVIRNLNPVRDLRSLLSGPEELNSEELVYESEDSLDEESTSDSDSDLSESTNKYGSLSRPEEEPEITIEFDSVESDSVEPKTSNRTDSLEILENISLKLDRAKRVKSIIAVLDELDEQFPLTDILEEEPAIEEKTVEEFDTNKVFVWLENCEFDKLKKYLKNGGDVKIYNDEDENIFEHLILKMFTSSFEFNEYRNLLRTFLKKPDLGELLSDAYDLLYERIEKIKSNRENLTNLHKLRLIEQEILPYLIESNSDNKAAFNIFLTIASKRGYTVIIENMLKNDINYCLLEKKTLTDTLFRAIKPGYLGIVKLLIEDLEVNPDSHRGSVSAMAYASSHERKHIAKYLYEQLKLQRQN